MAGKPRVVLDSNILISAFVYGGKPEQILRLILEKQIDGFTSSPLLSELFEVLIKKFHFSLEKIQVFEQKIKKNFLVVYPEKTVHVVKDEDDNKVLEVAVEGGCDFIITGDKELLRLGKWKGISILTADQFLGRLDEFQRGT
ncbi:MAG: putative toxin-antitoxin system toxin component, PIN family [Candidatus Blackburnbacteria bacterium]|nr:putative toxin-antitoxin system toxin component, PIN family [Candidatus Blackburnbacteria bacterium]